MHKINNTHYLNPGRMLTKIITQVNFLEHRFLFHQKKPFVEKMRKSVVVIQSFPLPPKHTHNLYYITSEL